MVTVRPAQPGDASAAARVGVAAWQAAYRGLMPDAYLDGLAPEPRADAWRAGLAAGGGSGRLLVGTHRAVALVAQDSAGDVLGFVTFGDLRDPLGNPPQGLAPTGEVWALNVAPGRWRAGLGGQLLARAVAGLADAGHAAAALWVVVGNHRARRFYEHEGWRETDEVKTDSRLGFAIEEVRYDRRLSPVSAAAPS